MGGDPFGLRGAVLVAGYGGSGGFESGESGGGKIKDGALGRLKEEWWGAGGRAR